MVTNPLFRNYNYTPIQNVVEDLVICAIQQKGVNCWYMPRQIGNYDPLYTSDDQSYYNNAFLIEMYLASEDGFEGDGSLMSKFGLEITASINWEVSIKRWSIEVGQPMNQERPNEGDLIMIVDNMTVKIFQVKSVSQVEAFYQYGKLYTYNITSQLFDYGGEIFNTGISSIDSIGAAYSLNIFDWAITDEFGNTLMTDGTDYLVLDQYQASIVPDEVNETVDKIADKIIDWTITDPFSELPGSVS